MPLPTNAKIMALVCSGLILPNVVNSRPRLNTGNASWSAINSPTITPTMPQTSVARINNLTILLS